MSIGIYSDEPIQSQEFAMFGFCEYANVLTEAIKNSKSPVTFGIFGDWGTGKTSLMRLIYNQLWIEASCNDTGIFPVWFDAWRFDNDEDVTISLLYTIHDDIHRYIPNRISNNPYIKLEKFLAHFICAFVSGTEIKLKNGQMALTQKFNKSIEAMQKLTKGNLNISEGLEKKSYYDLFYYLKKMINDISVNLVVFIDDLDRCRPEKVSSILETMKLTMNIPGIIFVIAADRNLLERISMKGKYGNDVFIDGDSYLKKIIQVYFSLPPLKYAEIERYIEYFLTNEKIGTDDKNKIVKMIAYGAGPNPREIKRLINNFIILRALPFQQIKSQIIVFLLVVQHKWPQIFNNINTNRETFIKVGNYFHENWNVFPDKMENFENILTCFDEDIRNQVELLFDISFLRFLKQAKPDMKFTYGELDEYIHFLSISSLGTLTTEELRFVHSYKRIENSTKWEWVLKPEASETIFSKIKNIEYSLPPSKYTNHHRVITREEDFKISDVGETIVPIKIKVALINGENIKYTYMLDFNE